jgi:hypothetical protein
LGLTRSKRGAPRRTRKALDGPSPAPTMADRLRRRWAATETVGAWARMAAKCRRDRRPSSTAAMTATQDRGDLRGWKSGSTILTTIRTVACALSRLHVLPERVDLGVRAPSATSSPWSTLPGRPPQPLRRVMSALAWPREVLALSADPDSPSVFVPPVWQPEGVGAGAVTVSENVPVAGAAVGVGHGHLEAGRGDRRWGAEEEARRSEGETRRRPATPRVRPRRAIYEGPFRRTIPKMSVVVTAPYRARPDVVVKRLLTNTLPPEPMSHPLGAREELRLYRHGPCGAGVAAGWRGYAARWDAPTIGRGR